MTRPFVTVPTSIRNKIEMTPDNLSIDQFGSQGEAEVIDVAAFTSKGLKLPKGKKYKVFINDKVKTFTHPVVTGREILEAQGQQPCECFIVVQIIHGRHLDIIDLDEKVDLSTSGFERFVTRESGISNYTVDDEPETTTKRHMTPNEILTAAGIKAVDHYLVQVMADNSQVSYQETPDAPIEMKCTGQKFVSIFRGATPVS